MNPPIVSKRSARISRHASDTAKTSRGVVLGLVEFSGLRDREAEAVGVHRVADRLQDPRVVPLHEFRTDDATVGAEGLGHQRRHGLGAESDVVVEEQVERSTFDRGQHFVRRCGDSDCSKGFPNCNWVNSQLWLDLFWNGIVCDRVGARLDQITDGASNTLLVGEKWLHVLYYETVSVDVDGDNATNLMAADNPGDNGSMYIGYDYDNVRACSGKINSDGSHDGYLPKSDSKYNFKNPQTDKKGDHYKERFGGPHPAGVDLLKCDGSVDTTSFDVDPLVWASQGTRNGGEL